jgi:hypothetical protein
VLQSVTLTFPARMAAADLENFHTNGSVEVFVNQELGARARFCGAELGASAGRLRLFFSVALPVSSGDTVALRLTFLEGFLIATPGGLDIGAEVEVLNDAEMAAVSRSSLVAPRWVM